MPRRRIAPRRLRRWLRGDLSLGALVGLSSRARDDLAWQAHGRLRNDQTKEAEAIYRLMAQFWPDDPTATLGLGVCRQLQGDLEGALNAYDAVLKVAPDELHTLANRAECLLLTHRPDEARAALATARDRLERRHAQGDLRQRIEQLSALASESKNGAPAGD